MSRRYPDFQFFSKNQTIWEMGHIPHGNNVSYEQWNPQPLLQVLPATNTLKIKTQESLKTWKTAQLRSWYENSKSNLHWVTTFHLSLAKIWKFDNTLCWQGWRKMVPSHTSTKVSWYTSKMDHLSLSIRITKQHLPFDQIIPVLEV